MLQYHSLLVHDASALPLDAWMEYDRGRLLLVIDDEDVLYPLSVDPGLSLTPD